MSEAIRIESLEQIRDAAAFLAERIEGFELNDTDAAEMVRDFMGHVVPAHERLLLALEAHVDGPPDDLAEAAKAAAYEAGVAAGMERARVIAERFVDRLTAEDIGEAILASTPQPE